MNSQELPKGRCVSAGIALTAALALAACSSGSASSSAASGPASSASSSVPAASATAAATAPGEIASIAPASATPTGTASPSWLAALGYGTVAYPPRSEHPGHGDPGQAVLGVLDEAKAKDLVGECAFMDPTELSTCKSQATQAQASMANELPYFSNIGLGYTVVFGNEALVGTTGTFCQPTATPKCYTNTDPAAILSAADETFNQLWNDATSDNSSDTYSLAPAVMVDGKWYVYAS